MQNAYQQATEVHQIKDESSKGLQYRVHCTSTCARPQTILSSKIRHRCKDPARQGYSAASMGLNPLQPALHPCCSHCSNMYLLQFFFTLVIERPDLLLLPIGCKARFISAVIKPSATCFVLQSCTNCQVCIGKGFALLAHRLDHCLHSPPNVSFLNYRSETVSKARLCALAWQYSGVHSEVNPTCSGAH